MTDGGTRHADGGATHCGHVNLGARHRLRLLAASAWLFAGRNTIVSARPTVDRFISVRQRALRSFFATAGVSLLLVLIAAASGPLSQARAAQPLTVAGVTYGQPPVVPGEFNGDLSLLSLEAKSARAPRPYRPLRRGPLSTKFMAALAPRSAEQTFGAAFAPMPGTIQNFAGLSYSDSCAGGQCGAGWPPDPNGDVGPNHYIEAVNDAVAIYSKTGTRLAAFTQDNLWSGVGSTPCNGNSQGDPIVVYDWLADRFILSWFAFFGSGTSPPFYQCIAASKTSDPVAGGWWLFAVRMDPGTPGTPPVGDINDYTKVALWHDCLYLSANEFDLAGNYDGVAFASFSRANLYSGAALTYSLGWLPPSSNAFTMVPSNNQGKGANAAQPGTPNYFVSESQSGFSFEVRSFTAGPNCGAGGTLSAPVNVSQLQYSYGNLGNEVPQPNTARLLDNGDDRILQKVQYRKIGGAESLWVTHNVDPCTNMSCTTRGPTAMHWAQLDVTGGTIVTTPAQEQIHAPDSTLYRWMGSLAVDGQGNMALGYSTSNATAPNFPSIAYSGRLATDPPNTLPQTEVQLVAGSGSQLNNCGGTKCHRWGDYTAMSVDPADDCTFWYVNQYYSSQTNGSNGNWQTRIGSFKFPSCVGLPPTTTTLSSSNNPSMSGENVDLTATVSGAAPTGTVDFKDGATSIAGCSAVVLSGGGNTPSALCSTTSLAVGTHSIVAMYSGDANNAPSNSAPLSQTVNGVPSPTLINPSFETPALNGGYQYNPNPPGVGWSFSGLSGIQSNGSAWGAAAAPDGVQTAFVQANSSISQTLSLSSGNYNLTFKAARRACCVSPFVQPIKVTLDGVQIGSLISPATTSFSAFSISFSVGSSGAHTLSFTGTDPGDKTTFIDSVALGAPGAPSVTLASSVNPVRATRNVTFTAAVSGTNPTGSVAFTSDGATIAGCAAVALSGSGDTKTAACTTSFATPATYSIVANYGGDANNPPMTSAPLSQVVKKRR
jgi:hypothetical protein